MLGKLISAALVVIVVLIAFWAVKSLVLSIVYGAVFLVLLAGGIFIGRKLNLLK